MLVFPLKGEYDESEFVSLGPVEANGAKLIEGEPRITGRVHVRAGNLTVGVFQITAGKCEICFPYNEYATILEGHVTLTDETGKSHTYGPGDSYFIRQGQIIIWEVKSGFLRKMFVNVLDKES